MDLSLHPARVDCPDISNDAVLIEDGLTEWIMEERAELVANGSKSISELSFNPVDVVPYEGDILPGGGAPIKCFEGQNVSQLVEFEPTEDAEFSIEVCTRGYCKGDVRSNWYLVDVNYPCVVHREGPLCGECKPGYAVTLYSTVSTSMCHFNGSLPGSNQCWGKSRVWCPILYHSSTRICMVHCTLSCWDAAMLI